MKTLKFVLKPCSVLCLCAVFLVSATYSQASFVSNVRDYRAADLLPFSLKPLQVVDCVLERCMWLTSVRAKGLCTYLICMRGADGLSPRPSSVLSPARDRQPSGEGSSSDVVRPDRGWQGRPDQPSDGFYGKRASTSVVAKRWQYPDPLQHCIQTNCQDERGVDFYTCVYKKCITALLNTHLAAPV